MTARAQVLLARLEGLKAAAPPGRAQSLLGALAATTSETLQRLGLGLPTPMARAASSLQVGNGDEEEEDGHVAAATESASGGADDEALDSGGEVEEEAPLPAAPLPGVDRVDALFHAVAARKKASPKAT